MTQPQPAISSPSCEVYSARPRTPNRAVDLYWHRKAVGELWEELGELQFKFLVEQGLKPEHYLLDIGCGSLRGGVHFIRYLKPRHYFGVDKDRRLLEAGKGELRQLRLESKAPRLIHMGDFNFPALGQTFEYPLAHSLFTHLPLNSIIRCIVQVRTVLAPGGRFYATFFENPGGKFNLEPIKHSRVDGPEFETYFDKDPYHYNFETFKWICEDTGLRVDYIGDWGHPRDQKMMVFSRSE